MERDMNLRKETDGKQYTRHDMARLGCEDCVGCSACCRDMEGLFLDPWDFCMLTDFLRCTPQTILEQYTKLALVDGLAMPRLLMDRDQKQCVFLDADGRCSVHEARPGICRLFPLGRLYHEDGSFSYILQVHECQKKNRAKVRIDKWLGIPAPARYEQYVREWHAFCSRIRAQLQGLSKQQTRTLHLLILQRFYFEPYAKGNFYDQFAVRLAGVTGVLFAE